MSVFNSNLDHQGRFNKDLLLLRDLPENKRLCVENRLMLIQKYEDYSLKESTRLGKKYRKSKAILKFCEDNEINSKTFYRHIKKFKMGGIKELIPKHGKNKNKSPYIETFLPIIKDIMDETKGYQANYDVLISTCEEKGINKLPCYNTFIRIAKANDLLDVKKRKESEVSNIEISDQSARKGKSVEIPQKRFNPNPPKWLKITNQRAFNIAIYKYSTILPLLDPDLKYKDKRKLIEAIIKRKHQPLPSVNLTFTEYGIRKYVSIVKKKGFEGLLGKENTRSVQRYKNVLWATFKIDMNDPLSCLHQIKDIIENGPATYPEAKEATLKTLDRCISISGIEACKYKFAFLEKSLTKDELKSLETFLRRGNIRQRKIAKTLLMANEGCPITEILLATNVSRASYYRWLKAFSEKGPTFLITKPDVYKNNEELRERKDRIVKIIHHAPKEYGINRTAWILRDIAKVYEKEYGKTLSPHTISRSIKQTNYTFKRAKRVLTSPDPEYREKTKKVLEALRNLGPNDAFFFIDEAGPYQVKKYGGRSLILKGTIKTFPQFQKPKGRVTFIGALDAIKNQVTMFFTRTKDTKAVTSLIKVLFFNYHSYSNLVITWDCASWHKSKDLQKCLDKLNAMDDHPKIKIVPLPKQSQFLNVIESLFSGMKKAVIMNSDYQSEYEMKMAIYKHFQERNEYYKQNPKRAGNKIWDKEYYDLEKIDSGLFKKM